MNATLSGVQLDRAAGVLLATACGDALGAAYEFGPPIPPPSPVAMVGGGSLGWEPGEWTDDTSMAIAIAEVAATGIDLRSEAALEQIGARWAAWRGEAKDVGVQTSAVLRAVGSNPSSAALIAAAGAQHARAGRSGGNGSLMRTAPVALAYLHDREALIEAARAISSLTHFDPEAAEACVLWCLAIQHAVLHGTFDGLRLALDELPADRAQVWAARLAEAETNPPSAFDRNPWVVQALQGAWSAIVTTPVPDTEPANERFPAHHLEDALEAAVRGGRDTDTVAAIAGGLLGARWGASAVPASWRRIVHGWPGLRARDLIRLSLRTARGGRDDRDGWPGGAKFDYSEYGGGSVLATVGLEPALTVGGYEAVRDLPEGVDAVVSLCRLGTDEVPAVGLAADNHLEVWLVDSPRPEANPHLDFVLHDTQRAVATFLSEGRHVLLHCVQAQSRTPTVLALHLARDQGLSTQQAWKATGEVLPEARPNAAFRAAVERLTTASRA